MSSKVYSACAAALLLSLVAIVNADIRWKDCEGQADHPSIVRGNYYNLCIIDEEFTKESHAWTFTLSGIYDTSFKDCSFWNRNEKTTSFNESNWNDVVFNNCSFGAFNEEPMNFENIVMTNVRFEDCTFHNSAKLNFTKFLLNNVTFTNSIFESDTTFELGEMNEVTFDNCNFRRFPGATTPSGDDNFLIRQVTARSVSIVDSTIVNPFRIEGVAAADLIVNSTTMNEFWCHSIPDKSKQDEVKYFSGFNDTSFEATTFLGNVFCDLTTWKGFFMANITFNGNAYFQNSDILNLYWDEVEMGSLNKETLELDFSKTMIKRDTLANTTINGTANFREAQIETVFVNNLVATKPIFDDAMFIDQEYIDGHCCSRVCEALLCKCNVSEPSGTCPEGGPNVNVSAPVICFPADATVARHDGRVVRMEDLAIAEKIARGEGEHSDVFFFGHRNANEISEYISIKHTGSDTPLRLSPGHYLYVDGALTTARSVRTGHRLRDENGKDAYSVIGVKREMLRGQYAPTTLHGDLLVDGVVVSSYTDVMHPGLSHKLLHPLRLLYRYGFDWAVSRVTIFHEKSYAHVVQRLGITSGPQVVGN